MQSPVADRLSALRFAMRDAALDVYLVPASDPHQSEYVPACWQRRTALSGFDGSAGDLVVTKEKALLWTDGRYWLQAERQLGATKGAVELMRQGAAGVPLWTEWLERLPGGSRVGVDARVLGAKQFDDLSAALHKRGVALVPTKDNLADAAWKDRPAPPRSPLRAHPARVAGKTAREKLADLRAALAKSNADAHLIAALDAIAWLFNLRGADVPCNPVFVAYALITPDGASIYTDLWRVPPAVREGLEGIAAFRAYEEFEGDVRAEANRGRRWWLDEAATSKWCATLLGDGAVVERGRSPVTHAKAVKNEAELAGMRAAHLRDAVAMVKFLRWVESAVPAGKETEITAADHLERLRAQGEGFWG